MNTKALMTTAAIFLGVGGILMIFAPDELAAYLGLEDSQIVSVLIQMMGGLYFGFAMLNWMNKGRPIGGIYNRPVVIANLSHFLISGLALLKSVSKIVNPPIFLWALVFLYLFFAITFGILLFRHPSAEKA